MAEQDSRFYAQRFALSRALALAGITTTLTIPLAFYARSASPDLGNVPLLSGDGRGYYLAAVFLTVAIALLVRGLETDDPARIVNRYGERVYRFRQPAPRTAWMLPAVGLMSIYLLMATNDRLLYVLVAPFICGGLVLASRVLRFEVLSVPGGAPPAITYAYQALVILVAAIALFALFGYRARAMQAMPVLFISATFLVLTLLDGLETALFRRVAYASVAGVAVAQVYWALNFWNISTLAGAGMLFAVFVFFAMVARAHLDGGINQQQVIVLVALTAPIFIFLARLGE